MVLSHKRRPYNGLYPEDTNLLMDIVAQHVSHMAEARPNASADPRVKA